MLSSFSDEKPLGMTLLGCALLKSAVERNVTPCAVASVFIYFFPNELGGGLGHN